MEIKDQIQKPPKITGSFLRRMCLSTKSVIDKSRSTALCVRSSYTTFVRTQMNLDVCKHTILLSYLKEDDSFLEFCGCSIWINTGFILTFLKLVWEQWSRIAFNSIAFLPTAVRKRESWEAFEVLTGYVNFCKHGRNIFCSNTWETKHCPQLLSIHLH